MTVDDLLLPAHGVHDGACILEASPDLSAMFGYAHPREVIGRNLLDFIAREDQDKTVRQVLSGGWGVYTSMGKKRDGSTFRVQVCARQVRYSGSRVRLILVRDLSPIALIVDDELVVCKMTAALVRRLGFRTVLADSVDAALEIFRPGKLSLLLTDVMMPGTNGIELGKRIRAADATLPIVYMSGLPPQEIPLDENSRYIDKPFGIAELEQAIGALPKREIQASDQCGSEEASPFG